MSVQIPMFILDMALLSLPLMVAQVVLEGVSNAVPSPAPTGGSLPAAGLLRLVGDDRQDGAEDLFLRDRHLVVDLSKVRV